MTTNSISPVGAAVADATTVAGPVSSVTDSNSTTTSTSSTTSGNNQASQVANAHTVDTVTLQGKARDAVKASPKQENDMIGGRISAVLFVYNMKGQLRIRYMDSKNSLVYQTPPVMMARTADLMTRSGFSVSARV